MYMFSLLYQEGAFIDIFTNGGQSLKITYNIGNARKLLHGVHYHNYNHDIDLAYMEFMWNVEFMKIYRWYSNWGNIGQI